MINSKYQIKQILANKKQTQKCISKMATKTLSMLLQITTKCSIQNTKSSNACNSRNKQKQIFNKQCAVELHCSNYTAHCTAKCKEMLHYKSIVHTQKHIYMQQHMPTLDMKIYADIDHHCTMSTLNMDADMDNLC